MNYKPLLLLAALLLATLSIAATADVPICYTTNLCYEGEYTSSNECYQAFNDLQPGTEVVYEEASTCGEVGCCVTSTQQQPSYEPSCALAGGEFHPGVSCDEVESPEDPDTCDEGETNCFCQEAGQEVSDGHICCQDGLQDGTSCEYRQPVYEQPEGTCGIDTSCQEPPTCSGETLPSLTINANHVQGIKAIDVDWSVSATICDEQITTFQLAWHSSTDAQSTTANWQAGEARLSPVRASTSYTITATAYFANTPQTVTATTEITTGDSVCFAQDQAHCADETTAINCDANNQKNEETCEGREVCLYTEYEGHLGITTRATCGAPPPCDECSQAFNNYAEATSKELTAIFPSGTEMETTCQEIGSSPQQDLETSEVVGFCSLDYDTGALRTMRACSQISSCSQYKSPDACENNACLLGGACQWYADANACISEDEERIDCNVEGITQDECDNMPGDACGFDPSTNTCVARDELTCEIYTTQEACLGAGSNFDVDPVTNEPTATSQNTYGLTKCQWREGDVCRKNSDAGPFAEADDPDFNNPTTTLLHLNEERLYQPGAQIPYAASDQESGIRYTRAHITTGSCENTAAQKPTSAGAAENIGRITIPENLDNGAYCIQYYSKDDSNNLEELKRETISVAENSLEFTSFEVIQQLLDEQTAQIVLEYTLNRPADCTITRNHADTQQFYNHENYWVSYELEQGQHDFQITCSNSYGLAERNQQVNVNIQGRVINPSPAYRQTGYRLADTNQISIHAHEVTSCSYQTSTGQWNTMQARSTQQLTNPTTGEQQSYTQYTATPGHEESKYYQYPIRCSTEGITFQEQIEFAVDEEPPRISVYAGDTEIQGAAVPVLDGEREITVRCEDPEITGSLEKPGDYSSGVDTFTAEEGINLGEEATIKLQEHETKTLTCTDNNGNQATRTITGQLESQGPDRPDFTTLHQEAVPEPPTREANRVDDEDTDDEGTDHELIEDEETEEEQLTQQETPIRITTNLQADGTAPTGIENWVGTLQGVVELDNPERIRIYYTTHQGYSSFTQVYQETQDMKEWTAPRPITVSGAPEESKEHGIKVYRHDNTWYGGGHGPGDEMNRYTSTDGTHWQYHSKAYDWRLDGGHNFLYNPAEDRWEWYGRVRGENTANRPGRWDDEPHGRRGISRHLADDFYGTWSSEIYVDPLDHFTYEEATNAHPDEDQRIGPDFYSGLVAYFDEEAQEVKGHTVVLFNDANRPAQDRLEDGQATRWVGPLYSIQTRIVDDEFVIESLESPYPIEQHKRYSEHPNPSAPDAYEVGQLYTEAGVYELNGNKYIFYYLRDDSHYEVRDDYKHETSIYAARIN